MEITKDIIAMGVGIANLILIIGGYFYHKGRDEEWKIAAKNEKKADNEYLKERIQNTREELLKEIAGNKEYYNEKFKEMQKMFKRLHERLDTASLITESECNTRHGLIESRLHQQYDSLCGFITNTKDEIIKNTDEMNQKITVMSGKINDIEKEIIKVKKNE